MGLFGLGRKEEVGGSSTKIKGVVERYKLKVERVRGLVCLVDVCFLVF